MKKHLVPAASITTARTAMETAGNARRNIAFTKEHPRFYGDAQLANMHEILASAEAAEAAALAPISVTIKSIEGNRVTARKLSAEQLIDVLLCVERHLDIPKTALIGTTINADIHAAKFPNCYRGIPESTHFTATYTAAGWAVTRIWRDRVTQSSVAVRINLTDVAREALIRRASFMRM